MSYTNIYQRVCVGDKYISGRMHELTCGMVLPTNSLHCGLNFLSGVNLRWFCFAHRLQTSAARRFNRNRSIFGINININSNLRRYSINNVTQKSITLV